MSDRIELAEPCTDQKSDDGQKQCIVDNTNMMTIDSRRALPAIGRGFLATIRELERDKNISLCAMDEEVNASWEMRTDEVALTVDYSLAYYTCDRVQ